MQIKSFLLTIQRQTSGMQKFILFILCIATLNFGQMSYHYNIDDFHYGPPMNYFPRFLVLIFLAVAFATSFIKKPLGKVISLLSLVSAFLAYLNWWVSSYEQFKRIGSEGGNFLNSEEYKQVAYLYLGNWIDVLLVVFIFIALILQIERLSEKRFSIKQF
jgi:hypothetical protein